MTPPTAASGKQEVFRNTEEDLVRLAELYARDVIISAEVQ
jgi:hypothetical protein